MALSVEESLQRCFKKFGDKADKNIVYRQSWRVTNRREPAPRQADDTHSVSKTDVVSAASDIDTDIPDKKASTWKAYPLTRSL